MRIINPVRPIMLAMAITVASTSGTALAGPEPIPTQASKAKQGSKSESQSFSQGDKQPETGGPEDTAQPGDGETAIGGESQAAPSAGSGAFMIARWMRSIGGKICVGPKIDSRTRVSRPNPNDAGQGWRVSVPTFASARMSAPPRRAQQAAPAEHASETTTEQTIATGGDSSATPN